MMYRQGDVLLIEVDESEVPKGLKDVPREGGKIILAHGEATGHTHSIANKRAKLRSATGQLEALMYLTILEKSWLRHQEHNPVQIRPHEIIVKRQREYRPEGIRQIED